MALAAVLLAAPTVSSLLPGQEPSASFYGDCCCECNSCSRNDPHLRQYRETAGSRVGFPRIRWSRSHQRTCPRGRRERGK